MPKISRPKAFHTRLGIGHTQYYEYRKRGIIPEPLSLGLRAKGHPEEHYDIALERLKKEFGPSRRTNKPEAA